jgi:hypothetical protein
MPPQWLRYSIGGAIFTRHASLFFYRGRELDDGGELVEGGGNMRSVTLRLPAEAERAS